MTITITQSLEWNEAHHELLKLGRKLKNYRDTVRILDNITDMVEILSKEEVNCRRNKRQTVTYKVLLENINNEINNYEQLITMGILCGC